MGGGVVEALCGVAQPRGGTWNREGVIVFSPNTGGGLNRISASGGPPTVLTTLDPRRRESSHRWPYFLPDGRHLLYYARSPQAEATAIYVASLDSSETRRLRATSSNAAYAPPGYLLFDWNGKLMAQPFEPETLRLSGEPVAVAEEVAYDTGPFRSSFTVSENGTLAYQTGTGLKSPVAWFDRGGKRLGVVASSEEEDLLNLALSPDDQRLAVARAASLRGSRNIWLYDLLRGTNSRLTFGPGTDLGPIWSPDGNRIVFSSDREGVFDLYQKPATGGASEELLIKTSQSKYASGFSPDGSLIVFESADPKTNYDLWVLPLTGERKATPLFQTPADEWQAKFSPDGRWLAYV